MSVNLGRKKPNCGQLAMPAGRASPNQTGSVVCVCRGPTRSLAGRASDYRRHAFQHQAEARTSSLTGESCCDQVRLV